MRIVTNKRKEVLTNSFDLSAFNQKLSTQWLGQDFHYYASMPSTNTYLKKLDAEEVEQGTVVLTDNQLKGRGQYERTWESHAEKNLTFSMVFKPQDTEGYHVLTMACALAVVEQLKEVGSEICTYIKWPNDVLLNDKKVAGLLTEAVFLGNKPDRLIIGIGLNVNQRTYPGELAGKATSIRLETGQKISREDFLAHLLQRIEYRFNLWHRKESDLLKQVNREINGYGQWVDLRVNGQIKDKSYKLLGVNECGRLVVLNRDGGLESFSYEQIRIVTD